MGFLRTKITESPRKNILLINLNKLIHTLFIPVLVDSLGFLLSFAFLWDFCPHFLDVLKDHIAVTIKGLDTAQKFLVVATVDQYLCVVFN